MFVSRGAACAIITGIVLCSSCTEITPNGELLSNGKPLPYWRDLRRHPYPAYPYEAKANCERGSGLFRIKFNYESGHAIDVVVLQTTGYQDLDQAAIKALRNWSVKPRTHRDIDVPVKFMLSPCVPEHPSSPFIHIT